MSEQSMWTTLRPLLVGLDPIRVENPADPGTPDVNYIEGWVELKEMPRWPPKGGPLRVDHYTQQQKTWARSRARAGGRVFLLLKVGQDWLLFRGEVAAAILGKAPEEALKAAAVRVWKGRAAMAKEIREELTK